MPKILSLNQLMKKRYKMLENLSEQFRTSFGDVVGVFSMIVWGESGNGKSNFVFKVLREFMPTGRALYVSLEEGTEKTIQNKATEYYDATHVGKILFADHTMTYTALTEHLKKKRSPKFIVIDSVQYWGINYIQYKQLKKDFPTKAFIFISHANGKLPDGKVANSIRYDVGIKVRVEGYVAFPTSRYGGNQPFVIWEEGAKRYWGKDYKKITTPKTNKKNTPVSERSSTDDVIPLEQEG